MDPLALYEIFKISINHSTDVTGTITLALPSVQAAAAAQVSIAIYLLSC